MPDDSPKPPHADAPRSTTVEVAGVLEAEEERVLRALHGRGLPDDFPLPQKDAGLAPTVQAKLRELEAQAFIKAGRVAELEAELLRAEAEEQQRDEARANIVARLRSGDVES